MSALPNEVEETAADGLGFGPLTAPAHQSCRTSVALAPRDASSRPVRSMARRSLGSALGKGAAERAKSRASTGANCQGCPSRHSIPLVRCSELTLRGWRDLVKSRTRLAGRTIEASGVARFTGESWRSSAGGDRHAGVDEPTMADPEHHRERTGPESNEEADRLDQPLRISRSAGSAMELFCARYWEPYLDQCDVRSMIERHRLRPRARPIESCYIPSVAIEFGAHGPTSLI